MAVVAMVRTAREVLAVMEAPPRARQVPTLQATAVAAVVVVQAGQRPATAAMALAATS